MSRNFEEEGVAARNDLQPIRNERHIIIRAKVQFA
jgi:hypothetical protein